MSGWTVSPLSISDAAEVTETINAAQHQWGRGDLFSEADFVSMLRSPSIDPGRDGRVLRDAGGDVLAAVIVTASEPWSAAQVYVAMPPHERRREGVRWGVDAGLALAASRPELSGESVVEVDALAEEDTLLTEVLSELGFAEVRRATEMLRDLDDVAQQVDEPLPEGIGFGDLRPDDDVLLEQLADVNRRAFVDHDGDYVMSTEDFVHFVRDTPSLRTGQSVVAVQEGRPVGLAVSMADVSDPEGRTGYMGLVGVIREARRRGVARGLLRESFRRYPATGWTRARLHVQIGNRTGADRLYRSVGMSPGRVDLTWARSLD